jgi:hypothetical protein
MSFGKAVHDSPMPSGGGTYFSKGIYDLTVSEVKRFQGQEDDITTVVVEFIVDKFTPKDGVKPEAHPVGSTVSWVQKLKPAIKKTVLSNLRGAGLVFLRQIVKESKDENGKPTPESERWEEVGEEQLSPQIFEEQIYSDNSAMVGIKVRSEAFGHLTKDKKEIVLNKWFNV